MLRQPLILSYEDVVHQVIWNNKNITVQKISLFEKHLLSKGIVTIGDLISDTGIFLKGVKVLHANLSPIQHFKLMSVVDAIPRDWRRIIRQSVQHLPSHTDDIIYLKLEISEVMLAKVTSKSLYNAFKSKKANPSNCAKKKFKEKFPQFLFDWKKIYSLPFTVTVETKIREFQYKVLNISNSFPSATNICFSRFQVYATTNPT